MNEECENCPHKGQCDMQCYGPTSVYWYPDDYQEDEA